MTRKATAEVEVVEDDSEVCIRGLPDSKLTPEQLQQRTYQRDYHKKNKARRRKLRAKRRRDDDEFRERDIERLRQRRADRRAEVAAEKFTQLVEEKRAQEAPTRRPRLAEIEGERVYVFGTSTLAREVGREDATIRVWLTQKILPGASVWVGRRAHFTKDYCKAVRAACRKLLLEDGRGDLGILQRLILQEFRDSGISFVRKRGRKRFRA